MQLVLLILCGAVAGLDRHGLHGAAAHDNTAAQAIRAVKGVFEAVCAQPGGPAVAVAGNPDALQRDGLIQQLRIDLFAGLGADVQGAFPCTHAVGPEPDEECQGDESEKYAEIAHGAIGLLIT
jgi:hypothetical protein